MKSNLTIVLLAVLIFVLGLVGYLFSSNTFVSPIKYEKEVTRIENISKTDDLADIEQDLDKTEFDNLDAELSAIETELEF